MKCPYCESSQIFVVNSRPTRHGSQIWRRRKCNACDQVFTTHEIIDLSHLVVIKKSGKKERFSSVKLFSGIYGAAIGYKGLNKEKMVDEIARLVERKILSLGKKEISSQEVGDIVLDELCRSNTGTFLRFFAYHKDIKSKDQMKKEIAKYLND